MKATITFEVDTDRKVSNTQLLVAIKTMLEMNDSMREFMHHPESLGDFTVNYVRVPVTGIVWEEG